MRTAHNHLVVLAILAALLPGEARAAEMIPPFDVRWRTEQAELVVHGRLDPEGRLTVTGVLKGRPGVGPLALGNGAAVFAALARLEKPTGSVEVVAYLRRSNGRWTIDAGEHGIVAFLGNGVYLVHQEPPALLGGARLSRHPTLQRAAFLKDARDAVATFERRQALLGPPPSADRIARVANFLLALKPDARRHHLGELSRALRPLSATEEKALAALLKAADPRARPFLLDLAGATARGQVAFAAVAAWADPRQPRVVRRAAIAALARIDAYRAQGQLAPLLRVDEPELVVVLGALYGDRFRLNPLAVEPLRKLIDAVRRRQRLAGPLSLPDESYALAAVVGYFAHPRLLPGLAEWVTADDHVTAGLAGTELRRWVGLCPLEDARAWDTWWSKAEPALQAGYDLHRAAGRRRWYHAYRAGSAETRRVLLRLWAFAPDLDEPALVGEAGGDGGEVAKLTLAALWQHGRLSGATRGALVEKFLSVRLEEVPGRPVIRSRELRIVGEKDFPFPPAAWVEWRASIVIGDGRAPELAGSFNASSLGEGRGPQLLGSLGGGSYPGSPPARARLALREVAHARGGEVAWKRLWELGPIRLRRAE